MIIFVFWWFIGIVTNVLVIHNDWKKGQDISLQDLFLAALTSFLGPLMIVLVFMTSGQSTIIFKGKNSGKS